VRGTITVYSEQPQSVREAFLSYQSALRGLGFAVVESGGLLKVVPEADAKLQTGTVSVGEVAPCAATRSSRRSSRCAREPEQPGGGAAAADQRQQHHQRQPGQQCAGHHRLRRQPAAHRPHHRRAGRALGTDVEVVPLQHAVASRPRAAGAAPGPTAAAAVRPPAGVPGGGRAAAVTVVAEPRSNSLIVRAANPARLAAMRATIAKLDRPSA
jgi:general secretion pathway protein D